MTTLELRDNLVKMSRVDREFSKVADSISPEAMKTIQESLLGGLSGSLLGGGAMGLYGAFEPKDDDTSRTSNVIRRALMGAMLGGTAGAAIPAVKNLLSDNGMDFSLNPVNAVGNPAASALVHQPGAILGAGLGIYGMGKAPISHPDKPYTGFASGPTPDALEPDTGQSINNFVDRLRYRLGLAKSVNLPKYDLIKDPSAGKKAPVVKKVVSYGQHLVNTPRAQWVGNMPFKKVLGPLSRIRPGRVAAWIAAPALLGYALQKSLTNDSGN
jgi:hypothetical protein